MKIYKKIVAKCASCGGSIYAGEMTNTDIWGAVIHMGCPTSSDKKAEVRDIFQHVNKLPENVAQYHLERMDESDLDTVISSHPNWRASGD
jgi:hypothetical protein